MNSLCHSRACEIIATNCDREVALFNIRCLMSCGDKQCKKCHHRPCHGRYHSAASLPSCLRSIDFPRPCATRRRHELPRYTLFAHSPVSFSSFPSACAFADLYPAHTIQVSRDKCTFSINFPLSFLPMTSSTQQRQLSRILNRRINRRMPADFHHPTAVNRKLTVTKKRTCFPCLKSFWYLCIRFVQPFCRKCLHFS